MNSFRNLITTTMIRQRRFASTLKVRYQFSSTPVRYEHIGSGESRRFEGKAWGTAVTDRSALNHEPAVQDLAHRPPSHISNTVLASVHVGPPSIVPED